MEKYGYLETEHINYFEHPLEAIDIRRRIEGTAEFIPELAALRVSTPPVGGSHLSERELEAQEKKFMKLTQPPPVSSNSQTRTRQ